MNLSGIEFIEEICKKLRFENRICTDSQIVSMIMTLDKYDLTQLINLGLVERWEKDKIKNKQQ